MQMMSDKNELKRRMRKTKKETARKGETGETERQRESIWRGVWGGECESRKISLYRNKCKRNLRTQVKLDYRNQIITRGFSLTH